MTKKKLFVNNDSQKILIILGQLCEIKRLKQLLMEISVTMKDIGCTSSQYNQV